MDQDFFTYFSIIRFGLECIALGSGQRLLLGSGLGLVLVLVCAYCSACADFCDSSPCDSGPKSDNDAMVFYVVYLCPVANTRNHIVNDY